MEAFDMGLKSLLGGKPTAADLTKQIGELEASIAAIAEEHEIAEAAAIEAASDPDKYEGAAAKSAAAKFRIDQARERLGRLQAAKDAAAASEQVDYIDRLGVRLDECRAEQNRTIREVAAARKAEEDRHAKALADLELRERSAGGAVAHAEHDLRRAKAGFPESSATRLKEIHAQHMEINGRYGEDLDCRFQQANGRFMAADRLIKDNKPRGILSEWQAEYDLAEREFGELSEKKILRDAERKPPLAEAERIRSSLPPELR
jgi:hypothetical protein